MFIEIFGPEASLYAVAACAVSYLISGHRSVYPTQLLGGMTKSASLQLPLMADWGGVLAKSSSLYWTR